MISSVEMVLWAIHHATTLLFGVFASAALCGVEINRRHALELVLVGAVTGCAFGLANAVGGELFARQVYPLVVHLPLVIYLCARYRLSPLLAVLGILLLGGIGIHKFYTGAWGWGIVYIVLCWTYIPALVALVEGIRYLTLKQPEFAQKAARMDGPFSFLW